jgi:hypothetical protein
VVQRAIAHCHSIGHHCETSCNPPADQECSTIQANIATAFYLFFLELQWTSTITLGFSDDVAGESRNRHFILSGNPLAIHTRLGLGEVHDGALGLPIETGWTFMYGFQKNLQSIGINMV